MSRSSLSLAEARRIALSAQGFGRARPTSQINAGHIKKVIHNLGLLQLDFVNVLVPAHYLVMFSRLGNYDLARFNQTVYERGEFTEQWAHEASIVPVHCWGLLHHRRQRYRPWPNSPIMKLKNRAAYLAEALEVVWEEGPITANQLQPVASPSRKPGDWHRSVPRSALEYHFGRGQVAVAGRLANFQRRYDLPERLIAADSLEQRPSTSDAQRELLRMAGVSLGVATLQDLADYYRMSPREARPRVEELVEEGALVPVAVESWGEPAFRAANARLPRSMVAASLLSPFDPVVWFRPRAERLFNFHYRIEIYVPEKKRKWGYYVLPFLLNDRLVARVDLKADRKNQSLLVQAAYPEENIDTGAVAGALAAELSTLGQWLGLSAVKVRKQGAFARLLAARVKGCFSG